MNWGPIRALLARGKRRHLRYIMRGYLRLKAANQLDRVGVVKDAISALDLRLPRDTGERFFLGAAAPHAERSVRQQLLMRLGLLNLNEALLWSIGAGRPLVHPLPAQWRATLREYGFQVAAVRSTLRWCGFVSAMFLHGWLVCCKHIGLGLKGALRGGGSRPVPPHAFFDGLSAGNLPQPIGNGVSHDVITWYSLWPDRDRSVKELRHGVSAPATSANGLPVVSGGAAVPPLSSFGEVARFMGWSAIACSMTLLDMLRGRWARAVLLGEAATAAVVRIQNPARLARDYLFHNSAWLNRRPWTFEAEHRGAQILFYFYSTNCEGFKTPKGYPAPFVGYRAMSWSRYLVWDEAQADFVRRVAGADANVSVVGPIWFAAGAEALPGGEGAPIIAVFDVVPTRTSYYVTLGLDSEYFIPRVSLGFLRDIHEVAQASGYQLYWKRKRKMAPNTHPVYRRFAPEFSQRAGVRSVDPSIAADRVIEYSDLVISMPFTATALIARELGKPSCYYDPTGQLQPDDRAAHGIPIVQGPAALAAWVQRHSAVPSRRAHLTTH